MAKQLNVNLAFTADTSRVKQDLEQLQNLLNRLTTNSAQKSPLGITNEIKTAISDVSKLQVALQKATTTTGTLNLGKFKQELNQAGLTAEKISTQLIALGPEGTKAFSQLTQSIMAAEIPLKQTSALLTNFATTLKNTARWQLSSSILHGFMGSIQTAYTYAQNLNKSLNNIRIVTGNSADEMADFAKEANEAAQALSTTTTEYTNASLIYYQQGLDDEAVKERTEATVKMANVSRESAEEVSQQMTAIWNNFDNGSKSLEYYSDVVTALGAATASSSAEIAQGLEKFAAAADTVGLSYEYATAALATVTATTRQSADVVGNAFKTLFSRMQGLKLGETLDDGTDLNKYSKALDAVGISIKNTDGELKQMDQILNELGARWQTLSKDQQMALAQTVAGVRQYTQLIALMDNWDFFEQNVRIAKDAEGTLDKQFKIYEEGWEAAQKRFAASMQDIYSQILNDDFFIDLTNAFTKIIQSIGKVMDSFGGLKGLLPGISALLLKMFGPDLSASIDRFANNIKIKFTNTLETFLQEREAFSAELQKIQSDGTISGEATANVYQKQGELQDLLIAKVRELQANNTTLSEQEQDHINKLIDLSSKLGEVKIKEAERLETLQKENDALQEQVMLRAKEYQKQDSNFNTNNFEQQVNDLKELQTIYSSINELRNQYINISNDEQGVQNLEKIIAEMQNLKAVVNSDIDGVTELQNAIENLANAKGPEERQAAFIELERQLEEVGGKAVDAFLDLKNGINGDSQEAKNLKNILDQLFESFSKLGIQIPKAAIAGNNFAQSAKVAGEEIEQASGKVVSASERFVAFGSTISSFAMSLQSINSIVNTINNPDLSAWDKFVNTMMSLGMLIPSVIRTWTQFNTLLGTHNVILDIFNAKKATSIALENKEILLASIKSVHKEKEVAQILKLLTVEEKEKINKGELTLVEALSNIEKREGIVLDKRSYVEKTKLCGKIEEQIALELKEAAARAAANPAILLAAAAIAALAAGLFIYSKQLDNIIEQQKKASEQATKEAEESRDRVEANQELILSYEELIEKYKKGEIEKSELYDATNKLAQAYDIEGAAIANLTGQYDEFTQKVKEASAAELERQKQKEKNAYEENVKGMWAAGTEGRGFIFGQGEGYAFDVTGGFDVNTGDISNAIHDVTGSYSTQLRIEDRNDPQQVLEYYENLQKIREVLINGYDVSESSSTIMSIDEELEQMSSYYEQAIEHLNNYNQLLLQEIGNTNDIINVQNINQVENVANIMKERLQQENPNMSEEDIDNLITEYLQNLGNDVVNRFLAQKELISEGVSEEIAQAFTDLNLSESDIQVMASIGFDIDRYKTKEELEEAVKDFQTLIDADNTTSYISLPVSLNINEKINKGKDLTKNEWDELKEQAPNAEDILGDKDSFNNKSIAERLQLMRELNEVIAEQNREVVKSLPEQRESQKELNDSLQKQIELQQERTNKLEEQLKHSDSMPTDAVEKLKEAYAEADAELQDLMQDQEALNDYINALDDAGYALLQTGIDSVLTDAQALQSAAELIGDSWTVAAENVEVFAQLFPDLVAEADHLADGSLKFTQEQVQAVLDGNAEIMQSNKEVIIQQIDDKLIQLRAEQEFLTKKKDILEATLNGEKSETQAAAELRRAYSEYRDQLEQDGVENHAKAASEATVITADMSNNLIDSLSTVNDAVIKLNDNIAKIGSGEPLSPIQVGRAAGTAISGNVEFTKPEEMDQTVFDALTAELENTTARLSEVGSEIASLEGSRSQILASMDKLGKTFDRVNSGKAGKEPKSKGGSSKDPDKKDHTDDEVDRYYEIENAIAEINHQLEINEQIQKRLSTYQNHYAGKTLIASLKKQNDLLKERNGILEKQYKNYEKLYEVQLQELGELKGKIGGNWNGNELTNYAELMQANIDKYNAVIDAYNVMSADQQKSTGKEMVEDAKKVYDKYKKALEDYQNLYYNKMYDTENKLAEMRQQKLENQFKIIENNLKGWETEIELKLDMTKMKREWKAFIHDVEQDFRKIYENLTIDSAFNRSDFDTYVEDAETRLKQIADVEAELRKMDASKDANGAVQISDDMMFGSISEAQEYLKKLQGELVDVGDSLNDMYEKVWDNYIKGLDQAKNNFEDINKEIEHLTKELEYEKELIELIYGDKAYDMMNRYYSTQQIAIENQISSTRLQAQFWEDQLQKAYQMNKDKHNVNMNDMSTWTEDMKKAYDEMISAQEKLNDLVLEGIKNLKDEYLNNVAKTLQEMDKAIWGMDFDDLKEDWDFLQKKADEYLDDVEGAYKIQDLANKIDQSIADSSSLKAQQKLKDLREDEITMLREKEHLTQSDIDLAEARYQIALKELALEDAQNNKTSMKLTRDTSGNWTYQYVADEEDVTNKRQELLDTYNNLYQIADEAYKHAMELAMEMYEGYKDKIVEIAEDTTISEEEKLQKMQDLRDQYMPEIIAAMENAQIYEQETIMATAAVFSEVCEQDADAYTTLTDLQKELVDMVRDQHLEDYEEIRDAILDNYQEIGDKAKETFNETNINSKTAASDIITQWDKDNGASVKGAMNDAFNSVIKYTQRFEDELYHLEEVSGKTIMDAGGVVNDIDNIGYAIEEVGYKTADMVNTAESYLSDLRRYVDDVENAWEQVVSRIREAINALQEYLNMSEAVSAEEARRQAVASAKAANEATKVSYPSSGSGSGNGSGKGVAGAERKDNVYQGVTDPYGARNTWAVKNTKTGEYEEISGDKEYLEKKYGVIFNSGWNSYMHFATGGYTGDWDSQSGKLAVLHEKELVLNATDTENMLAAVNAVRDMARLNDSISEIIANSIGQLIVKAMGTGNTNISTINNSTSDNTNNTFNITAEFPNANDVQTIRDAILSLPNIASQYVNSF